MFIVKAMRPSKNCASDCYTVWECDHYAVTDPPAGQTSDKNYIWPQKRLELYRAPLPMQPSEVVAYLDIGLAHDQGQFDTVYVMNDRGKTIDSVQARDVG